MRLIDADALTDKMDIMISNAILADTAIHYALIRELVAEQPTIEPEVRHGRWIKQENGLNLCSACGVTKVSHLPFCGHCGARMDATDIRVGRKGGDDNG